MHTHIKACCIFYFCFFPLHFMNAIFCEGPETHPHHHCSCPSALVSFCSSLLPPPSTTASSSTPLCKYIYKYTSCLFQKGQAHFLVSYFLAFFYVFFLAAACPKAAKALFFTFCSKYCPMSGHKGRPCPSSPFLPLSSQQPAAPGVVFCSQATIPSTLSTQAHTCMHI